MQISAVDTSLIMLLVILQPILLYDYYYARTVEPPSKIHFARSQHPPEKACVGLLRKVGGM